MNWWLKEDDLGFKSPEWDAVLEAYAGRSVSRSGWLRARCPICEEQTGNADKKESLGLNTKTGGYNCQKCQTHGRLPYTYRQRLSDVLDADVEFSAIPKAGEELRIVETPPAFIEIFDGEGAKIPLYETVRNYVTSSKQTLNAGGKKCRGIPSERAREMCLGTGGGKLADRVVFPVFDWRDPHGPWLGWFARDASGLNPIPHLYSRGLSRHTTVWNGAALFEQTDEPVFIMEGCLDAQAVWPHGVACLGKPIKSHEVIFAQTKRPIVVCLDGDAWREGQALAWSLALSRKRAVNLRLPPLTDPDEVPRQFLFDEARSLLCK